MIGAGGWAMIGGWATVHTPLECRCFLNWCSASAHAMSVAWAASSFIGSMTGASFELPALWLNFDRANTYAECRSSDAMCKSSAR
jgi:hypothetical protein